MATDASRNGNRSAHSLRRERPPPVVSRGQSEPLAALVAVSLVCLVVSAYVGLLNDTVGETGTARSVAEPTADAVWQDISDEAMFDAETAVREEIQPGTLPEGYNVAVTVMYIDDAGKQRRVARETFDESGDSASLSVPDDAERVTRAVTVRIGPGDKRPGRYTVEVWR